MKPQYAHQIGFPRWVARRCKSLAGVAFAGLGVLASLASTSPFPELGLTGFGNAPIRFEENFGQADGSARFIARGPVYVFSLAAKEATVSLRKRERVAADTLSKNIGVRSGTPVTYRSLQLEFVGANPQAEVAGESELAGRVNYFIGNDAANWRTGVPLFERVRVKEMYPGISLLHYGNQQHLEYDFVVAPNADPNAIVIRFTGADCITINQEGDLILKLGDDEIRQPKPVIYQEVNGSRKQIAGGYVLSDQRAVRFSLGKYDRSLPLVIDPVLSYSTYYGGSGTDEAFGVAVGTDGSIYVAGESMGGLPTTTGSRVNSYNGNFDAFVAKFDSSGTNVIYVSYIGGSVGDTARALAVDASGNAYITGWTESSNFPRTNAIFNQISGVPYPPPFSNYYPADAFVTKLGPLGTNLVYSTYLGGIYIDVGNGIAVDPAGNAYVAGDTQSPNFPTVNVQGSLTNYGGVYPDYDGFVAKIGPAGTNLIYSMYLGGENFDQASDVAADAAGLAYVVGFTSSIGFPVTTNAYQPWLAGNSDAFVTVIGPFGSNLVTSTFLGGVGSNQAIRLALDAGSNVYVTGTTLADPSYPITPSLLNPGGAFRSSNGGTLWGPVNNGLNSVVVLSLAVDPANPTRVYAGTSRGIARSIDGGQSWNTAINVAPMPRLLNLGPTIAIGSVLSIAVDPLVPTKLYAGTAQGIFKSMDAGVSWFLNNTNLNTSSTRALVIDPLTPAILYSGGDAGVYRSIDGGTNWQAVLAGQLVLALAIDPVTPSTIFAATAGGGVYRSSDRGTNWTAFNSGLSNLLAKALAINPVTPATLYVGTAGGVFVSTNAGSNWISVSAGLTTSNIVALAIDPLSPTTLYAGTLNGLFKTTNAGQSWVRRDAGIVVSSILAMAVNPQSPDVVYAGSFGVSFYGGTDVFVTKLGNNGFSAVFGGSSDDGGLDLAVSGSGRVHVVGSTASTDFPTLFTSGFLSSANSGGRDAFVSQLSPDGGSLLSSAYLGGSANDWANGIALDPQGNAYIAGMTQSGNFPTVGALQGTYGGGNSDAFIAKISNVLLNPRLAIETLGSDVRLSWSVLAADYDLQSNTSLQTTGGWVNIGAIPVESNGVLSVSLPATNPAQFFRLSNP